MERTISCNNAGLNSLAGYSYQIKVFIYLLTQIKNGQQVEFETLDDVAVTSIKAKDTIADSCLKYSVDADSSVQVFQVKQTNVTEAVGKKVLYNWLLALNRKPTISKFTLYIAQGYFFRANTFDGNAQREYDAIVNSKASTVALVSQVKEIYKDNYEQFVEDYNTICDKRSNVTMEDIDKAISAQLESVFHADAADVGEVFFNMRVGELFTRICARIMDTVSRRIPFICNRAEYMQLCEEIGRNISSTQYLPDYESFKQVHGQRTITAEILCSREYRQLQYCSLPNAEIVDHIRWEQYYQSIRQKFLSDAKRERIMTIENVAHQNHVDVVYELKEESRDTPLLRLIKTKRQNISALDNEYSKWGAYIFLTQENVDNQISWQDEVGDVLE